MMTDVRKKVPKVLKDKIALVAGATRGAGRGIAIALGEAGATVYCTGRSSRKRSQGRPPTPGRPETIEETAELVTAAGGRGIVIRVDGDSVFIITDLKDLKGNTYRGARQQFVKVEGSRGDQVGIVSGVNPGDKVVSSGVFKLRNGAAVQINNKILPGVIRERHHHGTAYKPGRLRIAQIEVDH
jgi:NAD(P)-dependent dehydrogenase (short-subunit alcohol dehydrogenase family)